MRRAYVTLLCNGDAYLPGVEALGQSLQRSGSDVARVLMVTPDIRESTRETLRRQGWSIVEVEPMGNPSADRLLFERFANVFTKLRAWELTDFDRVVWLDADTLVLQNIDELFERETFAAAPDFFLPDHFNSGVMVLEPSEVTAARMREALAASGSYDGGDQGFLNTFFHDWYAMPIEHRLPVGYNTPNFIYQFMRGRPAVGESLERDVRVLHYLVQKPWQARGTFTGGSESWWRAYFEVHPEKAQGWRDRLHSMQDRAFDRLSALALGG